MAQPGGPLRRRLHYLGGMPVIIVGADTPLGQRLIEVFVDPEREVRAFVSDATRGVELKRRGVKVATGDVSDASHIAAACTRVFTAILVTEAARDGRELSFASDYRTVLESWARAVAEAPVRRVIWMGETDPPPTGVAEVAVVSPDLDVERQVGLAVSLDDADQIPGDV